MGQQEITNAEQTGREPEGALAGRRPAFQKVHPSVSIPIAAICLIVPTILFRCWVRTPLALALGLLLGAVPALVSLVAGWKESSRRGRLAALLRQHPEVEWLIQLTDEKFGQQVAGLCRDRGYEVEEETPAGLSHEFHLRLTQEGQATIARCDRRRCSPVGLKEVRELFKDLTAARAFRSMYFTRGVFSTEARRFAETKPIELVDGPHLAQVLRQPPGEQKQRPGPSAFPSLMNGSPNPIVAALEPPQCPICGSEMVLREAGPGQAFGPKLWGCSMLARTRCEGTREVA